MITSTASPSDDPVIYRAVMVSRIIEKHVGADLFDPRAGVCVQDAVPLHAARLVHMAADDHVEAFFLRVAECACGDPFFVPDQLLAVFLDSPGRGLADERQLLQARVSGRAAPCETLVNPNAAVKMVAVKSNTALHLPFNSPVPGKPRHDTYPKGRSDLPDIRGPLLPLPNRLRRFFPVAIVISGNEHDVDAALAKRAHYEQKLQVEPRERRARSVEKVADKKQRICAFRRKLKRVEGAVRSGSCPGGREQEPDKRFTLRKRRAKVQIGGGKHARR